MRWTSASWGTNACLSLRAFGQRQYVSNALSCVACAVGQPAHLASAKPLQWMPETVVSRCATYLCQSSQATCPCVMPVWSQAVLQSWQHRSLSEEHKRSIELCWLLPQGAYRLLLHPQQQAWLRSDAALIRHQQASAPVGGGAGRPAVQVPQCPHCHK